MSRLHGPLLVDSTTHCALLEIRQARRHIDLPEGSFGGTTTSVSEHIGAPVAVVSGGTEPGLEREVLKALTVGVERTFEQDPAFALRLLADIALRALSPLVIWAQPLQGQEPVGGGDQRGVVIPP